MSKTWEQRTGHNLPKPWTWWIKQEEVLSWSSCPESVLSSVENKQDFMCGKNRDTNRECMLMQKGQLGDIEFFGRNWPRTKTWTPEAYEWTAWTRQFPWMAGQGLHSLDRLVETKTLWAGSANISPDRKWQYKSLRCNKPANNKCQPPQTMQSSGLQDAVSTCLENAATSDPSYFSILPMDSSLPLPPCVLHPRHTNHP